MNKFTEKANTQVLIKPQADIDTADITSTVFFPVSDYRRIVAIAAAEGPGVGKKLTVQLKQAKSDAGSEAKNLGAAVAVTAEDTEDLVAVAEAFVEQLDSANGFTYVGATIGTDKGSAVDGSCVLIRDQGRYSE